MVESVERDIDSPIVYRLKKESSLVRAKGMCPSFTGLVIRAFSHGGDDAKRRDTSMASQRVNEPGLYGQRTRFRVVIEAKKDCELSAHSCGVA
jgi:hypothetical protein